MKRLVRNLINFIKFCSRPDINLENDVRVYGSFFEGRNKVYSKSIFVNSKCGKGTYIGTSCYFNATEIGRFCSIGNRVRVILSDHPSSTFVSTHPSFYSLRKQAGFTFVKKSRFNEFRYLDGDNEISVSIGNDVWIGDDVSIIGGLQIGNGAIIAANSMVVKDVLPYSIVGGNPAKFIKFRFTENQINFLEQKKWWNMSDSWLENNIDDFNDIEKMIEND